MYWFGWFVGNTNHSYTWNSLNVPFCTCLSCPSCGSTGVKCSLSAHSAYDSFLYNSQTLQSYDLLLINPSICHKHVLTLQSGDSISSILASFISFYEMLGTLCKLNIGYITPPSFCTLFPSQPHTSGAGDCLRYFVIVSWQLSTLLVGFLHWKTTVGLVGSETNQLLSG